MCATAYWDTHVNGFHDYGMAEYLAQRGFVVVAVDHPGVGASSEAPDLFDVTPRVVSQAHHDALAHIRQELRQGRLSPRLPALSDLRVIGVGHSMGAMLVGVQQARHRSFDALVVLGHGGDGMPTMAGDEESAHAISAADIVEERVVALARKRFTTRPPPGRRPDTSISLVWRQRPNA
jgi:pimeloyl-ACP methyl ester carboxylesterase